MENSKICQSCGMPLDSTEILGTNADHTKNEDYCMYCFQDGAFTADITMQQMIDMSIVQMEKSGMLEKQNQTKEEALAFMQSFYPELKRWKNSDK